MMMRGRGEGGGGGVGGGGTSTMRIETRMERRRTLFGRGGDWPSSLRRRKSFSTGEETGHRCCGHRKLQGILRSKEDRKHKNQINKCSNGAKMEGLQSGPLHCHCRAYQQSLAHAFDHADNIGVGGICGCGGSGDQRTTKCDGGDVVNNIRLTTSTMLAFQRWHNVLLRWAILNQAALLRNVIVSQSDEYVKDKDIHDVNIATMCANNSVMPQRHIFINNL
jgi:hypothetical protein